MDEVAPEDIEQVEERGPSVGHSHDGTTGEDGTLAEHLATVHGLPAEPTLSPATQQGLHDRLHRMTGAADD